MGTHAARDVHVTVSVFVDVACWGNGFPHFGVRNRREVLPVRRDGEASIGPLIQPKYARSKDTRSGVVRFSDDVIVEAITVNVSDADHIETE